MELISQIFCMAYPSRFASIIRQQGIACHCIEGDNVFQWDTPILTICKSETPQPIDIKFYMIDNVGKTSRHVENDGIRLCGSALHIMWNITSRILFLLFSTSFLVSYKGTRSDRMARRTDKPNNPNDAVSCKEAFLRNKFILNDLLQVKYGRKTRKIWRPKGISSKIENAE